MNETPNGVAEGIDVAEPLPDDTDRNVVNTSDDESSYPADDFSAEFVDDGVVLTDQAIIETDGSGTTHVVVPFVLDDIVREVRVVLDAEGVSSMVDGLLDAEEIQRRSEGLPPLDRGRDSGDDDDAEVSTPHALMEWAAGKRGVDPAGLGRLGLRKLSDTRAAMLLIALVVVSILVMILR